MNVRVSELKIAVMTLTRLPVGHVSEPVPSMSSARWAYPLVGGFIGLLLGCSALLFQWLGLPALLVGMLVVTTGLIVTGALHEDGLADCADGFWGGGDRARKLEIMRDSRIGTYGTLALIISIGLRATSIAEIPAAFLSILGVAILSRFAMVFALETMPSARDDGLGASAAKGSSQLFAACCIGILGFLSLFVAGGFSALLVCVVMFVAAFAAALVAYRHIGGQTGDVLGGIQQVTEITGLVAMAALLT